MWRCGPRGLAMLLMMGIVASACTPTFDWREVRPDVDLRALFPCRPERHTRQVEVLGAARAITLTSCGAGDQTFALSYLDAPDIDRLAPLLQSLQATLHSNVTGPSPNRVHPVTAPAKVPGATPHPLALRLAVDGLRPDGQPVRAEAQFFCRGLRIYQATVIGRRLDAQALDAFFSSLTLST